MERFEAPARRCDGLRGDSLGLLMVPLLGREDADVGSYGRDQSGCSGGDCCQPSL